MLSNVLYVDSLLFVCYSLALFAFNRPISFNNMGLLLLVRKEEQSRCRKSYSIRNSLRVFIAGLPYKYILCIGRILGMLMYFIDVPHRRIVRRNLQFVYPEWASDHIKETSARIFQNIGITITEICQITCFSKDEILQKVKIKGEEHLLNAIKKNKGVILISAHLGNWEMVAPFLSVHFGARASMVGRQLRVRIVHRLILRLRTRFGATVIDKEEGMSKMMQAMRQGKILGIMLDQGTKSKMGIKVNFFNRAVTATPAAALLAIRCKSPVIPIFCIREANGKFTIVIESPLSLQRTGDLKVDLKANTQIMLNAIEKAIRAYYEQWFWVHKRWKKYYPHLYPEYIARRKRRRAKKNWKIGSDNRV